MGYYDCWPFRIIQNSKCSRFNSKYLCPSAEAVKAFSLDWSNEANWLVPPIYLSFKYLKHFALVHLELKGFWCYLVGHQLHSGLSFSTKKQVYKDVFRMYYSGCIIQDVLYLRSTVLEQGDYEGSFIGSKNFDSQVMALCLKVK